MTFKYCCPHRCQSFRPDFVLRCRGIDIDRRQVRTSRRVTPEFSRIGVIAHRGLAVVEQSAACDQCLTVGREVHGPNAAGMTSECRQPLLRRNVPQRDDPTVAAGTHELARGGKGHTADIVRGSAERGHQFAAAESEVP